MTFPCIHRTGTIWADTVQASPRTIPANVNYVLKWVHILTPPLQSMELLGLMLLKDLIS